MLHTLRHGCAPLLRRSLAGSAAGRPFSLGASAVMQQQQQQQQQTKPDAGDTSTVVSLPRLNFREIAERVDDMQANIQQRNATGEPAQVAFLYRAFVEAQYNEQTLRNRSNVLSRCLADVAVQARRLPPVTGAAPSAEAVAEAAATAERYFALPPYTEAAEVAAARAAYLEQLARVGAAAVRQFLIEAGRDTKHRLGQQSHERQSVLERLAPMALELPNWTHPDSPPGGAGPREVALVGTPSRPAGAPDHLQIGEKLDLFDFQRAAQISGSRFYFLKNAAALLELALVNYAMSRAVQAGFTPYTTPDLVYSSVAAGCGYQPRGEASQLYSIAGPHGNASPTHCLVGTSEIPLAGMHMNSIIPEAELPIRLAAVSHCFRREAGSYGQESRGLYRVHQFTKVEMFAFTRPDDSGRALDELVELQRDLFDGLELHYQVLDMPRDDLGAAAYRKYDIEAWMPGRGSFGEVSSASDCTDYQSRRLNIRYRPEEAPGPATPEAGGPAAPAAGPGPLPFVHTVNGTACAVPRAIVALLETHVDLESPTMRVRIPERLRPFMFGMRYIETPVPPRRPDTVAANEARLQADPWTRDT
ncbi:hypothetical protein H696_06090 [Fonticula alba]|uniref:serine--tRNA ligase n=1 Tax=Fonticula alba TaxID=691883 RepID=A0A058Z015_FONAL|nr:hypothetical protein H696_06090 [Fonticula alba]KCV67451.1 hypothetical protein H696_06090 [Fonticula alba]|eukprot:XP_009498127.1 hypothetical protein H696_06090 [Fonticula alba]